MRTYATVSRLEPMGDKLVVLDYMNRLWVLTEYTETDLDEVSITGRIPTDRRWQCIDVDYDYSSE